MRLSLLHYNKLSRRLVSLLAADRLFVMDAFPSPQDTSRAVQRRNRKSFSIKA
jgi:hypothetical protein